MSDPTNPGVQTARQTPEQFAGEVLRGLDVGMGRIRAVAALIETRDRQCEAALDAKHAQLVDVADKLQAARAEQQATVVKLDAASEAHAATMRRADEGWNLANHRTRQWKAEEKKLAHQSLQLKTAGKLLADAANLHDQVWNDDGVCPWCAIEGGDDEHGSECPYPLIVEARDALAGPTGTPKP